MRRTLTLAALACGLALGGCDSFDPLDKFQDWDMHGRRQDAASAASAAPCFRKACRACRRACRPIW